MSSATAQKEPVFDLAQEKAQAKSKAPAAPTGEAAAADPIEGDPTIQVFAAEAGAVKFFAGLKEKGAFNPTIHRGGIKTAISRMASLSGVTLMVVDISESANPVADIEALADVCEPGISVITLGEVNDIGLYRTLSESGVADYLVKPLTEEMLLDSVNSAMTLDPDSRRSVGPLAKMIAFVSARGGVGTSTIAMNSAAHLANGVRGKTLLLDLDLTFGSVALSLDLEPGRGLREALEAPDRMDALLIGSSAIKINDNFYVLASEEDVGAGLHPTGDAVNQLIEMVRPDYRNIVFDVPRDLAVAMPEVMARMDHLIIVSDLSLAGLRDANRLITFFKDVIDEGELSVMVNRTGINKRGEISERDFEKAIDRRLLVNIPEDLKAAAVINRDARPVSESARNSRLDKSVRELAQKLSDGKAEEPKKDSKFKLKKKKA